MPLEEADGFSRMLQHPPVSAIGQVSVFARQLHQRTSPRRDDCPFGAGAGCGRAFAFQTRTLPSPAPEARNPPVGETARVSIAAAAWRRFIGPCPSYWSSNSPVLASQRRIVRSNGSSAATRRPPGAKAIGLPLCCWPWNRQRSCPEATSHRRTVPSRTPDAEGAILFLVKNAVVALEASVRPSAENPKATTTPECPAKRRSSRPAAASQR